MRYITERELRDQFASGIPDRYDVPSGCMLTPAARQYLLDLKLYRHTPAPSRTESVPVPHTRKPEHMTNLNAHTMVCKTHPRILLRGKLDMLESEILLLECSAPDTWRAPLNDALLLVRNILSAEVREVPLPAWTLDNMDQEKVHSCSHHPENYGFPGHILPAPEHGVFAAQLNRLRTIVRETELAAVTAFWDGQRITREDIVLALNRLSSYFYVLQLRAVQR